MTDETPDERRRRPMSAAERTRLLRQRRKHGVYAMLDLPLTPRVLAVVIHTRRLPESVVIGIFGRPIDPGESLSSIEKLARRFLKFGLQPEDREAIAVAAADYLSQ